MPTPAIEPFPNTDEGMNGPYVGGFAVSPHNTNELNYITRALWIGTAGAGGLVVVTKDGSTLTFANVKDGALIPIRAKIVKSTGTDATNIMAFI